MSRLLGSIGACHRCYNPIRFSPDSSLVDHPHPLVLRLLSWTLGDATT